MNFTSAVIGQNKYMYIVFKVRKLIENLFVI